MNIKKILIASSIAFTATGVQAENFQTEIGAGYIDVERGDAFTVGAQYHFSEVDTSNKPLAEAGFLDRSSNIAALYLDGDDESTTAVAAEFYLNSFYVAPTYVDNSDSDGVFSIALGYVGDSWQVTTRVPEEDYEFNIDFKYVTALSGNRFINVEAEYIDGGDFNEDEVTLNGDYYFDETFSLGLIAVDEGDLDFGVRARKFFTSKFSASASYIAGDENDIVRLDVALRF